MPWIRRHSLLVWAAALACAALIMLGLSIFRDYWISVAAGESDIRDRGAFLFFFGIFGPLVAVSIVLAAVSTVLIAGVRPKGLTDSVAPALVGSVLGVVVWVLLALASALTSIVVGRWVSYLFVLGAGIIAGRMALTIRCESRRT